MSDPIIIQSRERELELELQLVTDSFEERIEALEAENALLREALEYYATDCREKSTKYPGDVLGYDMGKRAREALSKLDDAKRGESNLSAIVGQWPGDETDSQVAEALRDDAKRGSE